ncbi:MAG: DUF5121 domain-containing protein [Candidatus Cryptobacteroides sp.]
MKNIIRNIAVLLGIAAVAACNPQIPTPDQGKIPVASDLHAHADVDQESNQVTFWIEESNVIPLWIFGEEKIDGKDNKKYSYAQNHLTLRIREAGTHTVELRAYNSNGISQGSQTVEFVLENTYRDPFDASPYLKAIANTWVWDSTNAGHFGCGENIANPTGWWSCDANGKDGVGLYDDLLTFTAEGQYTFNPGEGGTVYANWAVSEFPGAEVHSDEVDYQIPIEEYTCDFSIENNWNDAGIEEIYLVLPEGKNLSYIPNNDAVTTNTRYLFVNTKLSDIKKNLRLINYSATANGGGSIAWLYSFVPYVKTATAEELLYGTTDEGKAWVMDAATPGHLGCGPSFEDPTGWWCAGAYEKKDFGLYDNELTFFPDGKYIFDSGEDGKIYVNWGVEYLGGPKTEAEGDFVVDFDDQESTFTFDGTTITFPEKVVIGYIPNNETYLNPVFTVKEITETKLVLVAVGSGISWQYIFRARDIVAPEQTVDGIAVVNGCADLNLSQGQTIATTGIDYAQVWPDCDFFEVVDNSTLKFLGLGGEYRIYVFDNYLKAIPLVDEAAATYDNGKALWLIGDGFGKPQGTAIGWGEGESKVLPFVRLSENTYKISVYYLGSASAQNASVKIYGQAGWGMEFTKDKYNSIEGNGLFHIGDGTGGENNDNGNIYADAAAAGWYVFTVTDNDGTLDIVMDKVKETYYDITGETNLWRSAVVAPRYWYCASDWTTVLEADAELTANNGFKANIPEGVGGSEWQAQNFLESNISVEAGELYDFCCTIEASAAMTITSKLAAIPDTDPQNEFFYNPQIALEEYTPVTIKYSKLSLAAPTGENIVLIFDFGRSPAGSNITVTDICFQKHQER